MSSLPHEPHHAAASGPANDRQALHKKIIAAIRSIYDPEIPVNIYDLGLIYGIEVSDTGAVNIRMTLTSPNCPVADLLPRQVKTRVSGVAGVTATEVQIVWEPTWTKEMMSEAAQLELGFFGQGGFDVEKLRKPPMTDVTIGRTTRRADPQ